MIKQKNTFPYVTEQLVLSPQKVRKIRINTLICKDDASHWIYYAPSLELSGYGDTPEEAKASFEENALCFFEDMEKLSDKARIAYLQKLGWKAHHLFKKHYSKVYVNEQGKLEGLHVEEITGIETVD